MSLSKYLQLQLLPIIKGKSTDELKTMVLDSGMQWFSKNPDELNLVKNNLQQLGIQVNPGLIDKIKTNILLHYFEKLLPLTGTPQEYYEFLTSHINGSEALDQIESIYCQGKGILLATAHFGAIEFITPYLSIRKLPMNILLRFTTEQMSRSARETAENYFNSGLFGQIRFIEIGKPKTSAALDMAAVLRRNEILLSVFDEKTDYSIPVSLFGKRFWGGAGLHKLIAYTQRNIALVTIFMVRLRNDKYKLVTKIIDTTNENSVQMLYNSLSELLTDHLDQWYFIHEELPFIESD